MRKTHLRPLASYRQPPFFFFPPKQRCSFKNTNGEKYKAICKLKNGKLMESLLYPLYFCSNGDVIFMIITTTKQSNLSIRCLLFLNIYLLI